MINEKYLNRGNYHWRWYFNKENEWYPELVDAIVEFCEGADSVLDVGCGDGLLGRLFTDADCQYTGVDADSVAIAMARYLVPKGRFLEKDISQSRMKGKWDYLACLNTIEHLDKPEVLLEILDKNITKGAIVITDKADPNRELAQGHVKEYTLDELVDFFKDYSPELFEIAGDFIGVRIRKQ